MRKLLIAAVVAAAAILPLHSAFAGEGQGGPPGNNGHIQLCETDTDFKDCSDAPPQNDPFLGCTFDIQFFNYDEGEGLYADYEVVSWKGTGNNSDVVASGSDIFIGGDSNDGSLDAQVTVSPDFSNADVDPKWFPEGPGRPEGYYAHVKVNINAGGSQGADAKHHTVWVRYDCGDTPPPPPVGDGLITITAGDCNNPVFSVTVENTGDEVITVDVNLSSVDPLQQPSNFTLDLGESSTKTYDAHDGETITVTVSGTETSFTDSVSATADLSGCNQLPPPPDDPGSPDPNGLPETL